MNISEKATIIDEETAARVAENATRPGEQLVQIG
jgi:hypothetical protein